MRRLVWLLLFLILFTACGQVPTPQVVTSQVTQLVTVEVTRLVIVTATNAAPSETPKPKATPAPTLTSAPTVDTTKTDKRDGSYMVGSEIAPGIWRCSGGSANEKCWIQIKNLSGDTTGIAGDLPGGTIRIPAGQNVVYIGGGSGNLCTWSFLMP